MASLFVVLMVSIRLAACWNQQYGDASSTSYVNYQGAVYNDWNYTTQSYASLTSPSVNHDGVLFYPLSREVLALSPSGTVLWKSDVVPDEMPFLTNTLYSTNHNLVIVGGSWGNTEHLYFMMTALDQKDGKIVWKTMQNDLFLSTSISLSETADAVFCGGADTNMFLAFSLINGSILWMINSTSPIGMFMQTKVGAPVFDGKMKNDSSELVLLPTDPYDGDEGAGTLYAYEVAAPGKLDWRVDLGFSAGGLFAFNDRGFLYGRAGGGGGPSREALFIVESSNGNPFYYGVGYCDGGARYTSGPAVDSGGYVYFSCGNRVFSLLATGTLRWISEAFGVSGANYPVSPSVHPNGLIYFIHNNLTTVIALSFVDGSIQASYGIANLLYLEPPILLGNTFMYLIGLEAGGATSIFTVKL